MFWKNLSRQGKWKFVPQYKELLDVTGPNGRFALMFTWGVPTVFLPSKEEWVKISPAWAKDEWEDLNHNLAQWCKNGKIILHVGEYENVFGETCEPPVDW